MHIKKQQLEPDMERWTGYKLGKEYVKAVYCHPAYKAQTGIKIGGRNINNLKYADDTTLMAESKEELEPLDENEKGEWKGWLKTQYLKH